MSDDQIKTFKIMEFLIMIPFFQYFSLNKKFTVKTDFKNYVYKSIGFFAKRVIIFLNKFPNQIKNSNRVEYFKSIFDD